MTWSHIHLMLNHIPVLGVIFGLVLAVAAELRRSGELRKAALVVLVVVGALAGLVYFTGEQAEETVSRLPGIAQPVVLAHDDAAFYAVTAACILGGIALIGLILFRHRASFPRWFVVTVLLLSLVTGSLMAWTANLGGFIRHPEIRGGTGRSVGVNCSVSLGVT